MIEQQCLADKILAELPEELAAATSFKPDAKGTGLVMDFAVNLDKSDYPLVLGVVKKFNGDFINQKDSEGKDHGCFFIPKLKDPVPAAEVKQEKAPDPPKQPSPVTIFYQKYCSVCVDFGVSCSCKSDSTYRELCLEVMRIQMLQQLNGNLEKLCKVAVSQPVQASAPAVVAPPKVEKVERSTRPTEGHKEGDVVWIYAENQGGERYEKALEKDNGQSNDYFVMRRSIVEAEQAGKKGVVLEGKWCWLSNQRDYIGRKPAKMFPKGGGH